MAVRGRPTLTGPDQTKRRGGAQDRRGRAQACVEIKTLRRVRPESPRRLHAIDATLLDGVAMPVPRRSTEPGRPRHRREVT